MYDALHLSEVQEKAEKTLMEVSRFLFSSEVRRYAVKDASARRYSSPVFSCYLDALQYGLARDKLEEAKRALELVGMSIRELVAMAATSEFAVNDVVATLHQVASRFLSLCLEEAWSRRRMPGRVELEARLARPGRWSGGAGSVLRDGWQQKAVAPDARLD